MNLTTEQPEPADAPFRLRDWLVEPRLNRLTRGDASVQIELKMMDVLVCLAGHAGDLVTRKELIDTVWSVEYITEKTLTRAVAELRRTLGDDAREPRYIETIHRKGYRLIAPVEAVTKPTVTVTSFPGGRALREVCNPYPGLAPFTEAQAELFFGRETEVGRLWRTITTRRLLAVIGPSGVGKTSFLRAGLIPAAPEGWRVLICTPGEAPFAALARALAPQFEGDPEAISRLVGISEPSAAAAVVSRWRERHDRALLVVDQFEELFTQNQPETQAAFAALIGLLARDVDVHVLLSLRDDFLSRCHDHEALRPVFSELTPFKVPGRDDLRRALVQPAVRHGFSFEDDALVAHMLDGVEGERGALPLLAFAVSQLWEQRDRERRLVTRQAYTDIGGVAGALAHHAEATIERVGKERLSVVREIFRNLVTAEGTRSAREWNELISIFSDSRSESPEEVVRQLVDARLLTSYEIREEDGASTRRVEIIHESLLANWPRLVRWQTQDADAAQLRDQLRRAARTWSERNRSDDLLWTGSAYREYSVWREHYPGGLSELEGAFSSAMTAHAKRHKRRRRAAVAMAFAVLLTVLGVIGVSRQQAISEFRRAEAANVFSLAQLELEEHPTAAIAYVIASLELSDSPEVRRLLVDALWRGPTEFRIPTASPYSLDFSTDGRWLATADPDSGGKLWPSDGGPPTILEGSDVAMDIRFSPTGDLVAANTDTARQRMAVWSVPEGRLLRSFPLGDSGVTEFFIFSPDGERLITGTDPVVGELAEREIRSWPVAGGEPDLVARLPMPVSSFFVMPDVDPTWSRLAWADGRSVRVASLQSRRVDAASSTSLEHDRTVVAEIFDTTGQQLATSDQDGTIRVWSLERDPPEITHTLSGEGGLAANAIRFDRSGSMLGGAGGFVWDLTAPPGSEPLRVGHSYGLAFAPAGSWIATGDGSVSLWPLARAYPRVLRGHEGTINGLAFTRRGERLVSASGDGSVRVWPLGGATGTSPRIVHQVEGAFLAPLHLAMAPDSSFAVIANPAGQVVVIPLDGGGAARDLRGFSDAISSLAIGPRSRLVAAGSGRYFREQAVVRVWDLESGSCRILDAGDGKPIRDLSFAADGDLCVASGTRLRRWQLDEDPPRVEETVELSVPDGTEVHFEDLSADGKVVLLGADDGRLWMQDLGAGEIQELSSHVGGAGRASFDAIAEIVVSIDAHGGIRVGPMTGDAPHLLLGPDREVLVVAVSADGHWLASGGGDGTIRVWPMPDLSRPPIHSLPRSELIAKLKTLTNLRAVEAPDSPSGWKIEVGPHPGWERVPDW